MELSAFFSSKYKDQILLLEKPMQPLQNKNEGVLEGERSLCLHQ